MKPRRVVARVSFRDQMVANQKTMDLYAALSGKPRVELPVPPPPKARMRDFSAAAAATAIPLEAEVQKQIIDGLRRHPMVGLVERVNSGTSVESNADGSTRHVSFHHVYSVAGWRMRAVDLHVTLHAGPWGGKRLAIEVKRPGWKSPHGDREIQQQAYLEYVVECGGYGIFAVGWDDVSAELARIKSWYQQRQAGSSTAQPADDERRR